MVSQAETFTAAAPGARANPDGLAALRRVRRLADLLDTRFRIPGLPSRFGLDGLMGLLPFAGDSASLLLSLYIFVEARRAGVRKRALLRMAANIAIDFLVGLVPLVGDIFDIAWKANRRNADIMQVDLIATGRIARQTSERAV